MLINTERLSIRFIEAEDRKSVKAIWEDFGLSEYSKYDRPHSTDDADVIARTERWAEANKGTEHMFFAVCLSGSVIGFCAFNARDGAHEMSYCFHSSYHGKGYAKESLLAIFDYLRKLGIKKLTAGTALGNSPSVSLLKSLGFELKGSEKVSFYKDNDGNDIIFDGGIFELII